MNVTSLRLGTRRITHGSAVSNVAAMMGSTAFLAPLIATSPCNGTPPLIERLSMKNLLNSYPPAGASHRPRAEGQDSWPASVIRFHGFDNPLVLDEELSNLLRLSVAGFEQHAARRTQMVRRFRGEPAIKIQPVRAAVEGETRVVVAHLWRQRLD